ncbi:uncharacterized protein FFNC_02748 [Fusarium fujikuroi]|nr:uncharacterized protein FFC1_03293 [Fusarium fujikuroi]SCO32198.1 uncharacterized protein FFNC_02748 [Fusarium fujikuroi]
MAIIDYYNLG